MHGETIFTNNTHSAFEYSRVFEEDYAERFIGERALDIIDHMMSWPFLTLSCKAGYL